MDRENSDIFSKWVGDIPVFVASNTNFVATSYAFSVFSQIFLESPL